MICAASPDQQVGQRARKEKLMPTGPASYVGIGTSDVGIGTSAWIRLFIPLFEVLIFGEFLDIRAQISFYPGFGSLL